MAEMSNFSRARVGCVVALRGRILATGINSKKTHPIQLRYNKYRTFRDGCPLPAQLHAETAALIQLDGEHIDWSKVNVYIYRLRHDQPYGLAAPCLACRQYIKDLGIRSIYYTSPDGYAHEIIDKEDFKVG